MSSTWCESSPRLWHSFRVSRALLAIAPELFDGTAAAALDPGALGMPGAHFPRLTLASLGSVIGFVTQETYLFHASVRDNLLYAKPEATHAELESAARAAAIHERVMELPDGYDTIVGERGYKPSGGGKQRIADARGVP